MPFALSQIAEIVSGTLEGNPSQEIEDIAEIQHARPGEISFLGNPKYSRYLESTRASAILVPRDFNGQFSNIIRVENPNYAYAQLIPHFRPGPPIAEPGIHPSAAIDPTANVAASAYIGSHVAIAANSTVEEGARIHANCSVGYGSHVGKDSVIYANVTLYHDVQIGRHVILHSGTVVGSDGFGFVRTEDGISKIPQAGGVVIGDEVEIGANCAIDRGTLGPTEIQQGTKIDNLVQIAHNVKIGKYCFIAGQVGIAGSATIEDQVTIAGQVGIVGHITVGKGAIIAAQSGVSKPVQAGALMFGYPAQEMRKARRELANIRMIPDLKERLKALEKLVNQ